MAAVLRSYMNEEITAFAFDEALSEMIEATSDETVQNIGRALWFLYDDCTDHKVVASKEEWDYYNRLLLLLESDGELAPETPGRRTWRLTQAMAAVLFIGFLAIAFQKGFGPHLMAYALPFGPPSMLLAWIASRQERKAMLRAEIALTPFSSVGNLLGIRRRVRGFARLSYKGAVTKRRIRGPIARVLMRIPGAMIWCLFAPVVLAFQMLPGRKVISSRVNNDHI